MVTATVSRIRSDKASEKSEQCVARAASSATLSGRGGHTLDRFVNPGVRRSVKVWSWADETLEPDSASPESLRLTADEEAILFRRMITNRRGADALREALAGEPANAETREAIQRHTRILTELRNYLVRVFSKLATSVAGRYVNSEFRLDELLSEAHVTLLRAVELFDPDRGYRFSTYATNAIRHNLHRYISSQHKARTFASPSVEPESLADDVTECPRRREREYRVRMERITQWIRRLDTREQTILESRYGLSQDSRTSTLQCLADQLGVSRERIRQLERRAIAKLQGMARSEMLEVEADTFAIA